MYSGPLLTELGTLAAEESCPQAKIHWLKSFLWSQHKFEVLGLLGNSPTSAGYQFHWTQVIHLQFLEKDNNKTIGYHKQNHNHSCGELCQFGYCRRNFILSTTLYYGPHPHKTMFYHPFLILLIFRWSQTLLLSSLVWISVSFPSFPSICHPFAIQMTIEEANMFCIIFSYPFDV